MRANFTGLWRLDAEASPRRHAHWQDDALIIETTLSRQDRDLHFRDCWSLSDDRATLTMAHWDDALDGQTVILIRDDTAVARFDAIPTLS